MQGLLAVWNDCDDEAFDQYEHWYQTEHLPERVGLPGVHNGVRHEAALNEPKAASPRFFTSYDLEDTDVLNSAAYQAMLQQPSPQTRLMMPHFRNMWRFVGRRLAADGRNTGAWTVTIRLGQLQGGSEHRQANLGGWRSLMETAPPPRACRWRLYESILAGQGDGDRQAAAAPSPEARFRHGVDSVSHGVLLIEHLREGDARDTRDRCHADSRVKALLHPQDRIDCFLEMSRLDKLAMRD